MNVTYKYYYTSITENISFPFEFIAQKIGGCRSAVIMIYGRPFNRYPRDCNFKGSYCENNKYVQKRRQKGMGYGLIAICDIPHGAEVAEYGGDGATIYRSDEELHEAMARSPSTKVMQICSGVNKVYIDAKHGCSLGSFANHGCGVTEHCAANVTHVFDDENKEKVWLCATRLIKKGEWIFFDYGYRYDEEVDGNDTNMCWMKGLKCSVCNPVFEGMRPAIFTRMPERNNKSFPDYYKEICQFSDEENTNPLRLMAHFLN